jgi:hypothetical protein
MCPGDITASSAAPAAAGGSIFSPHSSAHNDALKLRTCRNFLQTTTYDLLEMGKCNVLSKLQGMARIQLSCRGYIYMCDCERDALLLVSTP